jgi:hypothetical protein
MIGSTTMDLGSVGIQTQSPASTTNHQWSIGGVEIDYSIGLRACHARHSSQQIIATFHKTKNTNHTIQKEEPQTNK